VSLFQINAPFPRMACLRSHRPDDIAHNKNRRHYKNKV
jgi:hypothetical protein